MSSTEIVQMVLAIVNIVLPGVDPATLVGPLVTINQNASVTNIGTASALSGGSSAVVNILSAAAGQAGLTTGQLASMVSAQASSASGAASAVGNIAWTDIMQFASVIMSVNGDTSLTSALTSIMQNAQVSNQGSASATSGAAVSTTTIQPTGNTPPNPSTQVDPGPPPDESSSEQDESNLSNHKVLLWGPISSPRSEVIVYVDARPCKYAEISKDPDFPGSFIWETTIGPSECGAYRGARVSFVEVNPSMQTVTWDNLVRESPEIRLNAGGSPVGTALQAGR